MLLFLDCFKDGEQWDQIVGIPDPHYSSAYYRAFGAGKLVVLVVDDTAQVVQPIRSQEEGWIGNAYNFGGPLGSLPYSEQFAIEFSSWKQQNSLNERCTLNPFFFQCVDQMGLPMTVKDTVYIDLEKPLKYRKTTSHCITKAISNGVTSEQVEAAPWNVTRFNEIYQAAMEAKNADLHWRYFPGFFARVLSGLGPQRSALFHSRVKGDLESACVLIFDDEICYYHWAARCGQYPSLGVDHLQVDAVAKWAQSKGIKRLHLGGGLRLDDGLLTFKAGFSDSRLPCRSYVTKAVS